MLVRERQPNVPVILATGYMNELPVSTHAGPTWTTMAKPYRLADLAERVRISLKVDVRKGSASGFQHEG